MALEPRQGDLVPALALAMGDDADIAALVLEDRALLDMQFEIGAHRPAANGFGTLVADALQFTAERQPIRIGQRKGPVAVVDPGEDAGGQHRRGEARAFLVGPVDHLDRVAGADAEIVEGAHHLQRAEHAERTVELAAGRLGVEMAAHQDRRQRRIAPWAAGEHVAHGVDADGAAGGLAPAGEEVTRLPVEIRQRQPVAAALRRRADRRHLHQAVPQAQAVDAEIGSVGHGGSRACVAAEARSVPAAGSTGRAKPTPAPAGSGFSQFRL